MEQRLRNELRSTSFSGTEDWRNRSNLMSISELFSELRDTFIAGDFDLVEKTLIDREERLKKEIEEKKKELELAEERMKFEKLERVTLEFKLERLQAEMNKKILTKKNGHERGDAAAVKNHFVRDDDGVASAADVEKASQNVGVLAKDKKGVDEQSKKDRLRASDTEWQSSSGAVQKNLDTRLAKPTAIPPGDAMRKAAIAEKIMLLQKKNQFKSSGRLNFDGEGVTVNGERLDGEGVEVLAETKRLAGEPSKKDDLGSSGKEQKNSSGVVQEDLATKLVESIGIKRGFPCTDLDFLNNLDSSDSSSSSSSSDEDEFDMVISNKKMRTNVSQSTNGLY